MNLDQKIETYLNREVDFSKEVQLEAENLFDDAGEYTHHEVFIKKWNITDKPEPTEVELEAITEYINPRASEIARAERDRLIAETDWTQMADVNITDEKKEAYKIYRQVLRDISKQDGFPHNIIWAEKPLASNNNSKTTTTNYFAKTFKGLFQINK